MESQWITRLPQLLDKNITEKSILLVKLLTIVANFDNKKSKTFKKICPARLIVNEKSVKWYINDVLEDTLIIETPIDSKHLGVAILPNDDEGPEITHPDVPHDMYIISSCKIAYNGETYSEPFSIIRKTDDEIITTASTHDEAVMISEAVKPNFGETKIIEQ